MAFSRRYESFIKKYELGGCIFMIFEEKLAIFGGEPACENFIPYGTQYIDDDDINAVVNVLKSPFLTTGPTINLLEKKICEITNANYAVALSNGTASLHVACMAAGLKEGDEVIVSSMTFVASANVVLYCGAIPVFADIDDETWNIDPESIKDKITSKTKAIIAVDFGGQAVELNEIKKICTEHNLILIEDAAHSIGTKYDNKPVGSIADMTIFSFHPVKTVTAGEGGAITTNSEEFYKKINMFKYHGITRDKDQFVNKDEGSWYYEQQLLGFNYRITDIQCTLLNSQLNKMEDFAKRRKEIVEMYDSAFDDMKELSIQKIIPNSDTCRHLYIIRLNLDKLKGSRKEIFDALRAENIGVNVHYMPVYYHPYYKNLGYEKGLCKNAEKLYEEMITISLFYTMRDEDVESVIRGVKKVISYYRI